MTTINPLQGPPDLPRGPQEAPTQPGPSRPTSTPAGAPPSQLGNIQELERPGPTKERALAETFITDPGGAHLSDVEKFQRKMERSYKGYLPDEFLNDGYEIIASRQRALDAAVLASS